MASKASKAAAAISDFQERLHGQRAEALKAWRQAVNDHVAGGDVDLESLNTTASRLGIAGGDIAAAFSLDVAAVEKQQAARALEAKRRKELERMAPDVAAAEERRAELEQELSEVRHQLEGADAMRYAIADSATTARRAEQASPRMFAAPTAWLAEQSTLREVQFS
jgi:hypothetical protein